MDWHKRYQQQETWTRDLRAYLFENAGVHNAHRILEVGCGTGAILSTIDTRGSLYGLDIDSEALALCRTHTARAALVRGDGLTLPYSSQSFDIVFCHYFLLWVRDPLQAAREMKRVTRPYGHILALAEPDYGARVDKPDELKVLGEWQVQSLKRQGADPGFGVRLAETFFQVGIDIVEAGPIRTVIKDSTVEDQALEWAVIESDLKGLVNEQEIEKMKLLNNQARARGERILHIPTYFAWGQVRSV